MVAESIDIMSLEVENVEGTTKWILGSIPISHCLILQKRKKVNS
jgi:hypothetical protein